MKIPLKLPSDALIHWKDFKTAWMWRAKLSSKNEDEDKDYKSYEKKCKFYEKKCKMFEKERIWWSKPEELQKFL